MRFEELSAEDSLSGTEIAFFPGGRKVILQARVEAPPPEGVLEADTFECLKHRGCALLHIRPQVKEATGGKEAKEGLGEVRQEDGAFFVGIFPPRVRKLQVDAGEALRLEEPGNMEARIQLHDEEVKKPEFLCAEGGFAREFFTPLEGDVGDMGVGLAIGEGEAAEAAADFHLEGAVKPEEGSPVRGCWGFKELEARRLCAQRGTRHNFSGKKTESR